ncbi:hypothetical protein [Novosphingobium sp. Gsoil 351]|uniref:COG3904 family protein n=1 Tax=Novosphingobium sp. Gsoil 351 TaxID=2675225 RepID=UPI0012B4C3D3|nr:hypothetical protein [Novosphingobium sp. Gsoil 351]QGN53335.1 hypothetical protein GKE62_00980 [Novosphingobium sp. Gsoil 351]
MAYIQPTERTGNYIFDHWNGAQPLAQSYWINGSLIGVLATIGTTLAVAWLSESGASIQSASAAVLAATGILLTVTLWGAVGIWRSSNRHVGLGGSLGWANAAKAMVVLSGLSVLGQASNLAQSTTELAGLATNNDSMGPPASVRVANGLLRIDGPLSLGTADAVARAMADQPNVQTVEINSPGGRIGEAREIARMVREREADTVAGRQCMSACTVVLLAGLHRSSVGGGVGFHQASFPGLSVAELHEMNAEMRQSYVNAGLPGRFIDQALARGPDDMWFPDEPELFAAGVLNSMTRERIIDDNLTSAQAIRAKAPTKVDNLIILTSAKASGMKLTFTYQARVDRSLLDLREVGNKLKSGAQHDICQRPMAPMLLRSGAIYEHEYLDQNGALITRYQITACDTPR